MAVKKNYIFYVSEATLYHRLTLKIAKIVLCKYETTGFVRECLWKKISLMYNSVKLIKNLPELIFPFAAF